MNRVTDPVARPPSDNSTQIAIRIPDAWLERADALRPKLGEPGFSVTRTDIVRAALARGLVALEAEALDRERKRAFVAAVSSAQGKRVLGDPLTDNEAVALRQSEAERVLEHSAPKTAKKTPKK